MSPEESALQEIAQLAGLTTEREMSQREQNFLLLVQGIDGSSTGGTEGVRQPPYFGQYVNAQIYNTLSRDSIQINAPIRGNRMQPSSSRAHFLNPNYANSANIQGLPPLQSSNYGSATIPTHSNHTIQQSQNVPVPTQRFKREKKQDKEK